MSDPRSPRHLIAPTVGTGVLMAAYLLVRPYGDADGDATAVFASNAWVVAHVCGALALASFARLATRLADVYGGLRARAARTLALVGVVLVLPYYGAETFALHEIGRAGGDAALVDAVRNNPVAMTLFGLGLVPMALAGALVAHVWARRNPATRWGAAPLGVLVVLFLPQFFLAPQLRAAYGVLYVAAAAVLLVAVLRTEEPAKTSEHATAIEPAAETKAADETESAQETMAAASVK